MRKKTQEQYIEELSVKNPNVIVIGKYIDAKTPIEHYCIKHDVCWNISPTSALRGSGCDQCSKEKISMRLKKTHEEYVAEVEEINSDIDVVGTYVGADTPILHRCKKHNITWMTYPTNILRGCGCYMCGNNTKKTHDQYVNEVAVINTDIEVIGEYINARTPIEHRCKKDGYTWMAVPYAILSGDRCPKCVGNAKKTTQEYADELSSVNNNIDVIGEYINAHMPIAHRCKIDGYIWNVSPCNTLSGRGCPMCKFTKLSNMFVKTHEQYVSEVALTNPDLEVVGQYINSHTPILHQCKKDGYIWKIEPSNVLFGQGCPQCSESSGERQIRQWLQKHNIMYEYQKTFTNCRDKKELPFDFYLPKYSLCIEYDGTQHFEPIDFAGNGEDWALDQFAKTQCHDEIKNQYCKDNNIGLLRIPYFKNVQEELEKFLFI